MAIDSGRDRAAAGDASWWAITFGTLFTFALGGAVIDFLPDNHLSDVGLIASVVAVVSGSIAIGFSVVGGRHTEIANSIDTAHAGADSILGKSSD